MSQKQQLPPELQEILAEFAKQVVLNQPEDVLEFATLYFEQKAKEETKRAADLTGRYQVSTAQIEQLYQQLNANAAEKLGTEAELDEEQLLRWVTVSRTKLEIFAHECGILSTMIESICDMIQRSEAHVPNSVATKRDSLLSYRLGSSFDVCWTDVIALLYSCSVSDFIATLRLCFSATHQHLSCPAAAAATTTTTSATGAHVPLLLLQSWMVLFQTLDPEVGQSAYWSHCLELIQSHYEAKRHTAAAPVPLISWTEFQSLLQQQ